MGSNPTPSAFRASAASRGSVSLILELPAARAAEVEIVFAVAPDTPFEAERLYRVADSAWEEAGIPGRLRLHRARHTYASFMIAAGVNPKALSSFMGHSSITVTFDRYGHLTPGTEAEGATLLGERGASEGSDDE